MSWEEKYILYKKLVQKAGFQLKGKTVPYTSDNGRMFSQLNKIGELGIRFSSESQEKYIKKLNTAAFKSFGSEMKGYVLMPEYLWKDLDTLVRYLRESHDHIVSFEKK